MRTTFTRFLSVLLAVLTGTTCAVLVSTCAGGNSTGPDGSQPVKLAIIAQPSSTVASGEVMSPSIRVAVEDASGATVTTATPTISIAIVAGSGANGATLGGTLTETAVNGVATFGNLTVDKAGTGYLLTASAQGTELTGSTSNAFDVTPGAPTKLAVTGQPATVASLAVSPAIRVTVQDANGNVATSATTSVTIALTSGAGTSGAVLGGTLSQDAVNGIATFNNLTVDKVGTGYTLTATAPSLTSATSNAFAVTAGAAAKLAFSVQPTAATSGAAVSPGVQVLVQDVAGNTVTNASTSVHLAISSGTGASGAALGGTIDQFAVNGVATFSDLTVDKVGTGYTLSASATSLTTATSSAFAVSPGAASKLSFAVQPTSVAGGAVINPAVQVTVQDAGGNTVSTATNSITMIITGGSSGAVLGGILTVSAVNGVATFNALTVDKASTGYYLVANSSGLTSGTSNAFAVTVGAPSALAFTGQPDSSVRIGGFSNVQVSVQDAGGNTVTTATTSITVALLGNTAGAVLGGTTTVSAFSGEASFSPLTLDKPGQGFTLRATATGLASATSTSFIGIGPVTKLAFVTQPSSAVRHATITPAIVITVQDAAGNVVPNSDILVTMAIGTNAGSGTLSGALTRYTNYQDGLATFNDLSISAAGSGYTLAASATGIAGAISSTFRVTAFGPAAKLGFIVHPSNADVAAVISPAVKVAILDASGNTVTTSSSPVTVAFGANPGGGTLGGTLTSAAASGVATFSNVTVSAAGIAYTLTGSSASLTSATSAGFNVVNTGAAIKLGFVQQPTGTTAGSTIVPAVTVAIQNSAGATITTDNTTVVAITVASAPIGGTVRGTLTATATNGVATFSTLSDTVAGSYTLRASAPGFTAATSATYAITPGVAARLLFLDEPTNTVAGELFAPVVRVAVADAFGNTVPTATNSVTITNGFHDGCLEDATVLKLTPHQGNVYVSCGLPGLFGPPVGGTLTVVASNGIASFPDLRPRFTEVLSLSAEAPGLEAVTSGCTCYFPPSRSFTVTPSSAREVWVETPGTSGFGTANPQVANRTFTAKAFILDSLHNQVDAGSNIISLALGSNPSAAMLTVASNMAASDGRADFTVSIDKPGNGYTILGSTAGLSSLSSFAFNVDAFGPASRLSFTTQPSNTAVGAAITPAVQVCVQDGVGNTVTTATNDITIAFGSNPGTATLGGALTAGAVSGCATFANLTVSAAGSGYSLTASATSLTGNTSTQFNISP